MSKHSRKARSASTQHEAKRHAMRCLQGHCSRCDIHNTAKNFDANQQRQCVHVSGAVPCGTPAGVQVLPNQDSHDSLAYVRCSDLSDGMLLTALQYVCSVEITYRHIAVCHVLR